jgi:hypothetical protein
VADPSDVDAAIVAALKADTGTGGLMTLMVDGVFVDVAPSGSTKFVIVSLATHRDEYVFEGPAFEESTYLVKAVDLNVSGIRAKSAAARIDAVLQDAALSISGYALMLLQRQERVRYTEVDDDNKDIRWQHRGGRYSVFVSPT